MRIARLLTLQSVDCPCLKLLQRDLSRGWQHIEVKPVFIVLLLELGLCKLSFLVIQVRTALGIDSGVIVANHVVVVILLLLYGSCGLVRRSVKVADAVASTRTLGLTGYGARASCVSDRLFHPIHIEGPVVTCTSMVQRSGLNILLAL